jgi:protein-S-isoprenylcysteine O-methyltransferase Ste14
MWPEIAIAAVWLLWLASWIAAALWADPAAKRPARGSEASYRIAVALGALLLMDPFDRYGGARVWRLNAGIEWLLVAAVVLGLLFAWWARLHLGRLWSSSVSRKAGHRVIDTGPYAIVRHPIYTGIIAAVFASAILKGTPAGVAGALVMTFGFWIKARLEERFLRDELGPEDYDAYRRRVPMLVPFGPTPAG